MGAFGLYNLVRADYLLLTLIVLSVTGQSIGWFFLRYHMGARIIYRINAFLFSVLMLYMLFTGGDEGSKILWMYIFPLISFFLLGKTEGLFWCVAVFLFSIVLFWNPLNLSCAYDYSLAFTFRFLITYLIVSIITFWFEYFRYHYRIDIEHKNQLLQREITDRKQAEKEREILIAELQQAVNEVKTLSGFLPICASCKKIRDDKGYWNQIENYIRERTSCEFSHGICPDCARKTYPEFF